MNIINRTQQYRIANMKTFHNMNKTNFSRNIINKTVFDKPIKTNPNAAMKVNKHISKIYGLNKIVKMTIPPLK